jgi:hypothetical protein
MVTWLGWKGQAAPATRRAHDGPSQRAGLIYEQMIDNMPLFKG